MNTADVAAALLTFKLRLFKHLDLADVHVM